VNDTINAVLTPTAKDLVIKRLPSIKGKQRRIFVREDIFHGILDRRGEMDLQLIELDSYELPFTSPVRAPGYVNYTRI
jgi:hypothetical protein